MSSLNGKATVDRASINTVRAALNTLLLFQFSCKTYLTHLLSLITSDETAMKKSSVLLIISDKVDQNDLACTCIDKCLKTRQLVVIVNRALFEISF